LPDLRGVFINPAGKHDVATAYAGTFKAGFNKLESTVDEGQVDDDTPAALGKFPITGKNDKSDALIASGTWTAESRRKMESANVDSSSDSTKERLIVKPSAYLARVGH
jgi:hypothetical protein